MWFHRPVYTLRHPCVLYSLKVGGGGGGGGAAAPEKSPKKLYIPEQNFALVSNSTSLVLISGMQ